MSGENEPWEVFKKQIFQQTGAEEKTESFRMGVIGGYHEAGNDIAKGKAKSLVDVESWARGMVAGYKVCLEVEEQRREQRRARTLESGVKSE